MASKRCECACASRQSTFSDAGRSSTRRKNSAELYSASPLYDWGHASWTSRAVRWQIRIEHRTGKEDEAMWLSWAGTRVQLLQGKSHVQWCNIYRKRAPVGTGLVPPPRCTSLRRRILFLGRQFQRIALPTKMRLSRHCRDNWSRSSETNSLTTICSEWCYSLTHSRTAKLS